jgi:hypothetical protein
MAELALFYSQIPMEMLVDIKKVLQQEAEYADDVEKQDIQEELEENQIQIDEVQAKADALEGGSSKMEKQKTIYLLYS